MRAGSKGPETRQEVSIKIKQEVQDKEHWEKQKDNSAIQPEHDMFNVMHTVAQNSRMSNFLLLNWLHE